MGSQREPFSAEGQDTFFLLKMGRPVIQSILALLLVSALSHNSNGEANDAGHKEHTKQLDENQVSSVENLIVRIVRDAKIKSHTGRKGNNQNKKKADKERSKSRNAKKNMAKNKKKMGRNRKKKGKKNKKQLSKTKKTRTKKR